MRIVAGRWRGRRILGPTDRDTRPTTDRVREAWMSAVAQSLVDARVLDLFAGSGALGLEALSRGARHVTFIEASSSALRVLERNIGALQADPGSLRVLRTDAIRFVASLSPLQFDLAFADPPYGQGFVGRLVEAFTRNPFARLLCIEHHRDEPITGVETVRERQYGDTLLTFLSARDEP